MVDEISSQSSLARNKDIIIEKIMSLPFTVQRDVSSDPNPSLNILQADTLVMAKIGQEISSFWHALELPSRTRYHAPLVPALCKYIQR